MAPELQPIVACINRIRRRLWLVRLSEAATTALLLAALTSIFIVASRLLSERYRALSVIVALSPIILIAWAQWRHSYWLRFVPRFSNPLRIAAALLLVAHASMLFSRVYLTLPLWIAPAAAAVLLIAVALLRTRKASLREAAIFVDLQAGLREQVSTALEWANAEPPSPLEAAFRAPLLAAATQACATVRNAKVGYARLNRRVYGMTLLSVLVAGGMTLVNPLQAINRKSEKPNALVMAKAVALEEKIKEIEKAKLDLPKTDDSKLESIKTAITDLKRGDSSNLDAYTRMQNVRDEMQKELDQQTAAMKAQKALESTPSGQSLADATNKARDLMTQKGDQNSMEGARQKAGEAVSSAAKDAGDKLASGQMSPSEKKQLGDALKAAAGAAGGDKQLKESLENAGKALAQNDGKKLSEALSDAGNRMSEQMAENKLSGEALSEAIRSADAAARDLANNGSSESGSEGQTANSGGDKGDQGNQEGNQQADSQGGGGDQQNGGSQGSQASAAPSAGQSGGAPGGGSESSQAGGSKGDSSQSMASSGGGNGESKSGGSTNWQEKSGPGDESHDPTIGREGKFVKIYDETSIANRGKSDQVGARVDGRGRSAGDQETRSLADKSRTTIQDYGTQIHAAGKDAEEQLSRQQIPQQYRDVIRKYYAD